MRLLILWFDYTRLRKFHRFWKIWRKVLKLVFVIRLDLAFPVLTIICFSVYMCIGSLRFSRIFGLNLKSAVWTIIAKVKPSFEIETEESSSLILLNCFFFIQCCEVCSPFARFLFRVLLNWFLVQSLKSAHLCGAGLPTRMPYLLAYFLPISKISLFKKCWV